MANETFGRSTPKQAQTQLRLEQLRAEFLAAATQGSRPNIDDYLKNIPGDGRETLLRELLSIEFARRLERREEFSVEEYRRRFPQFGAVIQQLFEQNVKYRELKGYEGLQLLGGGGMGVVYKARQIGLNRLVAIKFLADHCSNNEKMIARFEQEKQSIGQLNHDNIVQAYDAGEDRGRHYLVMEFVDGICVADLIKKSGPLPPADACEIARQACEGLEYARKKRVVHRDIKPSNLMISREGTVKILDFGLARVKLGGSGDSVRGDIRLTTDNVAMGTIDYMAPEQFLDAKNVDHRADIYCLGCTLFHLLAGRAPFGVPQYGSELSKKQAHTIDRTPRVDEVRPGVPREVVEIVHRMMAKERSERFATASDVERALAPFAARANLVAHLDLADAGVEYHHGLAATIGASNDETNQRSSAPAPATAARHRGFYGALSAQVRNRPRLSAAVAAIAGAAVGWLLFRLLS